MWPFSAAIAVLLTTVPAAAQDIPARLTIDDAIRIARDRNPAFRQSINSRNASGANVRAGWAAFLPNLNLNLSFRGSSSRTITGQDDFGSIIIRPNPLEFQSSSASQEISTSITLFDGFGNINGLRAARAQQDASDAAVQDAGVRLDAQVSRTFYSALRRDKLVLLEEGRLASAREQLRNTELLFTQGGADQVDILGARLDVASAEQSVQAAVGEAAKAKLDVKQVLGIETEIAFEVSGSLPEPMDPVSLDERALIRSALEANPAIVRLDASLRAAEANAAAARADRWPVITAGASLNRGVSAGNYDALFELNPRNRSVGFSFGVSIPLFTRFTLSQRIAQASLTARNADEDVRNGRLTAERDVRVALIDLRNAYRALDLARQTADLARQRETLARDRWRAGALSFTNLQQFIRETTSAERGLIEAETGYATALVNLEEKVGRPVRP